MVIHGPNTLMHNQIPRHQDTSPIHLNTLGRCNQHLSLLNWEALEQTLVMTIGRKLKRNKIKLTTTPINFAKWIRWSPLSSVWTKMKSQKSQMQGRKQLNLQRIYQSLFLNPLILIIKVKTINTYSMELKKKISMKMDWHWRPPTWQT